MADRLRPEVFVKFAVPCTVAASLAFLAVAIYFQLSAALDQPPILARILVFGMPSLLLLGGCVGITVGRAGWKGTFVRMGDYSYSL